MVEYADIQTTIMVLLALASVIIMIDKVVEIGVKMRKPRASIEQRLDEYDKMFANDQRQLDRQDDAIKLLIRGMSQLMTHELDGNHVDQLAKTRDDMNEFLISKM